MARIKGTERVSTLAEARSSKRAALTISEGATVLGIDPRTVSAGIAAGEIPAIRVGRRLLVPREKFLALFDVAQETAR